MRNLCVTALLVATSLSFTMAQQLSPADGVRIREFYRLAGTVQDNIWPNWSQIPAPLLLVTDQGEFLTHYAAPPKGFTKLASDLFTRPRQFPTNLLATFPAFGPPAVIVIGEPANTPSRTSTAWLITLMHEHFHQLQDLQPDYYQGVERLGLSRGDQTGMWMLNYPFPYDSVSNQFVHLRDLLLQALSEKDPQRFARAANEYVTARKQLFAQLSPDDHKYLDFQLWQEGIARYTEIKVAEAAADYRPEAEYIALTDYEPFADYAKNATSKTLDELRDIHISKTQREVVYPWGAAEGLLLDRIKPGWKSEYFRHPFSLDYFFQSQ